MILCITEKPSVARDIAKILGSNDKHNGYYAGANYIVTWTFGHLCTLKEPADYTESWKRWSLGSLPMIPQRFGIKVIDEERIKCQFDIIAGLAKKADQIINCGDAGQEGELIQRWVMQKANVQCPVSRLWISSLTDDSIREGFKNIVPQSKFDNLYYAGLSRAIGDWILGMNATRLYTLKYSQPGTVLSIGRVQTPTLAIVVQRELDIRNFKSEDYWEIKTIYRDVTFNATSGKFSNEADAQIVMSEISEKLLTITDIKEKKGRETAPRLFDLTSLQVECNKKWGWSADYSLKMIQSLYEKKVTTYPRVDTTYLSEDIYPKIPNILKNMRPYASIVAPLLSTKIVKSKKVFDNSKVTDHHAIIPTGQLPDVLQGDEKLLYHLIARRFIAVFYPDCVFTSTTVLANSGDFEFKAMGKVILDQGWRNVYASDKEKGTDADENIMPEFSIGESGVHTPSLLKKATQPPKYYTEGTLLRAMESAGRAIEEEDLREAMKENGIGRPSTRAAIIETLFKRGYIVRDKKNIHATDAGIDLIAIIKDELLKSAKLTGIWENKLRRIERGDYKAAEFIDELKALIMDVVSNVMRDSSFRKIEVVQDVICEPIKTSGKQVSKPRAKRLKSIEDIICPECGQGHLLAGKSAFGCSRYKDGCSMRLNYTDYDRTLTPAKLKKLIDKNYAKK